MRKWVHLPHKFFASALFLYLVPVIFLLDKYHEYPGTLSWFTIVKCLVLFWLGAFLFAVGFWRIFRDDLKAHLMTAFLFICNFYFGPVQDLLAGLTDNGLFSRYRVLLPLFFAFLMIAFYIFKKSAFLSPKLGLIFSVCCLVLIIIKMYVVAPVFENADPTRVVRNPVKPSKDSINPDIYILVTDGYAGRSELKDLLHYDNDPFYSSLRERGFWVDDNSHSNYMVTPFSMASFYSMNYLHLTRFFGQDVIDARKKIFNNPFQDFLQARGYQFRNYSIFHRRKSKILLDVFRYDGIELVNQETLLMHLTSLVNAWIGKPDDYFEITDDYRQMIEGSNQFVFHALQQDIPDPEGSPRFTYAHILGPHYPYLHDSLGRPQPDSVLDENDRFSRDHYISYLKGLNKIFLTTIDSIQRRTQGRAIILFISDHGFRQFRTPPPPQYYYSNLLSVYLPDRHYEQFDQGMSNVNFLRAFLNQQFHQRWPMLADSMIMHPSSRPFYKKE